VAAPMFPETVGSLGLLSKAEVMHTDLQPRKPKDTKLYNFIQEIWKQENEFITSKCKGLGRKYYNNIYV
jgi:hypothetical protein